MTDSEIRKRRKQMGLTIARLAKRVGCSTATITKIEGGGYASDDMLKRVEAGLSGRDVTYQPPKVRFRDEEQEREFHEMWCRKYG